ARFDRAVDVGLPRERNRDRDDVGGRSGLLVRRAVDGRARADDPARALRGTRALLFGTRPDRDVVPARGQTKHETEPLLTGATDHRDLHRGAAYRTVPAAGPDTLGRGAVADERDRTCRGGGLYRRICDGMAAPRV